MKECINAVGAHFKLSDVVNDEAATSMDDKAYALGLVSRFMSKHMVHWTAVKWVLRYLKGAQDLKLCFRKNEVFRVEGFCDSYFTSDLDKKVDRRLCFHGSIKD